MFDQSLGKRLTLPVQMVNGQWEFVFGGELPVHEGTFAELVINPTFIKDQALRESLTQEVVVRVLPEGTPLRVALSDRVEGFSKSLDTYHIRVAPQYAPAEFCRFAPVWIGPTGGGSRDTVYPGLSMRHFGLDRCELFSSLIELPEDMDRLHALSLNHAYTLLSERYETHRMSHTGNVYERVFYQESNNEWYPLSTMRDGVRERAEREFLAAAWLQIERELGWCRLPPPGKGESRKGGRGER